MASDSLSSTDSFRNLIDRINETAEDHTDSCFSYLMNKLSEMRNSFNQTRTDFEASFCDESLHECHDISILYETRTRTSVGFQSECLMSYNIDYGVNATKIEVLFNIPHNFQCSAYAKLFKG